MARVSGKAKFGGQLGRAAGVEYTEVPRSMPESMVVEPASLPAQLGPYRIIRSIGSGGMAQVLLGRRFGASGWEKDVAIKILRAEHRGRVELERFLLTEARLGARFAHPNLIAVHDLGLADGVYYLCMDYVDGRDLAALLTRAPLPRALALLIGEQLAAALAYVHDLRDDAGRPLGLVHRDVSPGNVLLSRAGAVKLGDFGIAKATATDDRTWGRLHVGKFAYMAPEQLMGEALSGETDVFALGVTLHECLLGRRPFDREGPGGVGASLQAIRGAELAADHDFGDLAPGLAACLRSCLEREPKRRPDAAALSRVLQSARRSLPPVSTVDLAQWVCGCLDEGESGTRVVMETLGMDD